MKKLDMLFASIEDPNQTMDSIINYIANEQGNFRGLDDWADFLEVVKENCQAGRKMMRFRLEVGESLIVLLEILFIIIQCLDELQMIMNRQD